VRLRYAVQVRWPDDRWLYVMKPSPRSDERELFDNRTAAEQLAEMWRKPERPDAVRVVEVES
jgi:hypothetical protein